MRIQSLPRVECQLNLRCLMVNKESLLSYTKKLLKLLIDDGRIIYSSDSCDTTGDIAYLKISFEVYKVDGRYVERMLSSIYDKLVSYRQRTGFSNIEIEILKHYARKHSAFVRSGQGKHEHQQWKIKYFDEFWRKADFDNLSPYTYEELFRLHEWVSLVARANDKRLLAIYDDWRPSNSFCMCVRL